MTVVGEHISDERRLSGTTGRGFKSQPPVHYYQSGNLRYYAEFYFRLLSDKFGHDGAIPKCVNAQLFSMSMPNNMLTLKLLMDRSSQMECAC